MSEVSTCLANVSVARRENGAPGRVLIALSGGADSVALFCILKTLSEQEHFEIAAIHVHHGLRDTADRDAMFCRDLCKKHGTTLFVHHVHLQGKSENEARIARFRAFADAYNAWHADVLALAHHLNDQAETVLMHLLRGCGSKGLSGMSILSQHTIDGITMKLFRPLLCVEKQVLIAVANEMHGSYCHDETNNSNAYTRNYFRLQILPQIKEKMPGAEEAIGRTAQIIQTENAYLDHVTDEFLQVYACTFGPIPFIDYAAFSRQHLAIRRRIAQKFLSASEPFETIDNAAKIKPADCINLQKGCHLVADDRFIFLVPAIKTEHRIEPLHEQTATAITGDGIHTQRMPLSIYNRCTLRYRKSGDFIQPFGMKGTKSLQDYLVDRKISEPFRDYLPLLCNGSEVIWAIGVGVSEKVRATDDTEQIYLTYTGRLPYEKP